MKKLLQALGLLGLVAVADLEGMRRLHSDVDSDDAAVLLASDLEALGWQDQEFVPCKRPRGEASDEGHVEAGQAAGAHQELPEGVELVAKTGITILPRESWERGQLWDTLSAVARFGFTAYFFDRAGLTGANLEELYDCCREFLSTASIVVLSKNNFNGCEQELAWVLRQFTQLKILHLGFCDITDVAPIIAALPASLELLHLGGNNLRGQEREFAALAQRTPNLHSLALRKAELANLEPFILREGDDGRPVGLPLGLKKLWIGGSYHFDPENYTIVRDLVDSLPALECFHALESNLSLVDLLDELPARAQTLQVMATLACNRHMTVDDFERREDIKLFLF